MMLAFPASQLLISSSAHAGAHAVPPAADTKCADGAHAGGHRRQYWDGIALPRDWYQR